MTQGPEALTRKYGDLTRELKKYAQMVASSRSNLGPGLIKVGLARCPSALGGGYESWERSTKILKIK